MQKELCSMKQLDKAKLRHKLERNFDNVEVVDSKYMEENWEDAMDMLMDDVEELIDNAVERSAEEEVFNNAMLNGFNPKKEIDAFTDKLFGRGA